MRVVDRVSAEIDDGPAHPRPFERRIAIRMSRVEKTPILNEKHGRDGQRRNRIEIGIRAPRELRRIERLSIAIQNLETCLRFFVVDGEQAQPHEYRGNY